ncbi:hypothetical protein HDU97_009467 [Phlyctochytrium planicorne]|nr:hypothetical protein HDU97_009467 [Phlyctochytrium planicorne]
MEDISKAAEGMQAEPKMKPLPKHNLLKKNMSGFHSPTDQFMSPATQKVEAKRKHLLNTIQPKFLTDELLRQQKDGNE